MVTQPFIRFKKRLVLTSFTSARESVEKEGTAGKGREAGHSEHGFRGWSWR